MRTFQHCLLSHRSLKILKTKQNTEITEHWQLFKLEHPSHIAHASTQSIVYLPNLCFHTRLNTRAKMTTSRRIHVVITSIWEQRKPVFSELSHSSSDISYSNWKKAEILKDSCTLQTLRVHGFDSWVYEDPGNISHTVKM